MLRSTPPDARGAHADPSGRQLWPHDHQSAQEGRGEGISVGASLPGLPLAPWGSRPPQGEASRSQSESAGDAIICPGFLAVRQSGGRRLQAAAAWQLVRALQLRYPGRLYVEEVGSCSAPYHLLVLCDARQKAWFTPPWATLNVGGGLHLLGPDAGRLLPARSTASVLPVPWTLLCTVDDNVEEGRRQRRQARALAVTAIAVTLGL